MHLISSHNLSEAPPKSYPKQDNVYTSMRKEAGLCLQ